LPETFPSEEVQDAVDDDFRKGVDVTSPFQDFLAEIIESE